MIAILLASATALQPPPWRHASIHNLGNTGVRGAIHAALAPFATHVIDLIAYKGFRARSLLPRDDLTSVDFGCGVGMSTQPNSTGIDASAQMLAVARVLQPVDRRFERGLAERWGPRDGFDRVTCVYLLHEQPRARRARILRNAARVARREVVVLDIHPRYRPSRWMLTGEPYLLDYLAHIAEDMNAVFADCDVTLRKECDGAIAMWTVVLHGRECDRASDHSKKK